MEEKAVYITVSSLYNYLLVLLIVRSCHAATNTGQSWFEPLPYPLWTAISTTKSQTMPRVLATPVSRVLFTPLRSSNVPTAARPPAIAVAAGSFRHGNDHSYRKPACSYPCLIAMALASSSKESLQAGDIYKYIE